MSRVANPSTAVVLVALLAPAHAEPARFSEHVAPLLEQHCFDCHGDGSAEGGVKLDEAADSATSAEGGKIDPQLWWRVLKQVRAGLMPPEGDRLSAKSQAKLEEWIKGQALGFDPARPDPGRVTIRRLNRVEYRNTIRDLVGVEFQTDESFPPDDTGHGFDNLGEVLSVSPLLLEKYLDAATKIIADALPAGPLTAASSERERGRHERFFTRAVPETPVERRAYAKELLSNFTRRAFRRPTDAETIDRLVGLAELTWSVPNSSFESGVAKALVASLASPRFLFREDQTEPPEGNQYPLIDQYALATRLSYFLWSTMPDDELFQEAAAGTLRSNLAGQLARMLADRRSGELTRNFVGQWLQVRDIETVLINSFTIAMRDDPESAGYQERRQRLRTLFRRPPESLTPEERAELAKFREERQTAEEKYAKFDLNWDVRHAMRRETELHFDYVLRENRPLTELIDCDYTFLNEGLANFYQLEGIEGLDRHDMRQVTMPAGSHRGGVLTHGSVLAVTSNPDRTSPVKRGLFVLENILGTPPAAPPPNIPPLEDFPETAAGKVISLRESMAAHSRDPLCHSCHARMDPIGLALDNFSALGIWRDKDRGEPIDPNGELATGEKFAGIDELKKLIVERHSREFITCLTEKMLTYALGRGLDYHDVGMVDEIVDRVIADEYRPRALITGIVESAAFQRTRN
jgi:mono/diheme cytochrome c family protein